jgi:hypothetical protein
MSYPLNAEVGRTPEDQGRLYDILIGLATDNEFCRTVTGMTPKQRRFLFKGLFEGSVSRVCTKHFAETGEAPGAAIRRLCHGLMKKKANRDNNDLNIDLGGFIDTLERRAGEVQPYTTAALKKFLELELDFVVSRTKLQNANGSLHELVEDVDGIKRLLNGDVLDSRFPILDTEELLCGPIEYEPYLVENILVAGQPCLLGGPEKCMKTSLVLDLALSVVSGQPFLGCPTFGVVETANVLLMSGESGKLTIKKNLRVINKSKDPLVKEFTPDHLSRWSKRVYMSPAVPIFACGSDMRWLEDKMKELQIGMLIIDTAAMAVDGEHMPNVMAMYQELAQPAGVCGRLGATFVLNHHFHGMGKDCYRPGRPSDIQGAGFKEWARQWLLVTRREAYEPPDPDCDRIHRLHLVAGGSAGHSSCYGLDINEGKPKKPRWRVEMDRSTKTKLADLTRRAERDATEKLEENIAKVAGVMKAMKGGETRDKVRVAAKIGNTAAFTQAVDAMIGRGLLKEAVVKKGNNQPYPAIQWVGDDGVVK